MSRNPDVLIIGGGVIGLTAAYYLAREGLAVTVLDKSDFGKEASWAGAGIISPGNLERAKSPYDQLRARSAALFPVLSEDLRETTGLDNGYSVSGGLEWLDEDEKSIVDAWKEEGIRFEPLWGERILEKERALSTEVTQAYYLRDMAQVRNPRHLRALLAWCEARVGLRPGCAVHEYKREGNRIGAVVTESGTLSAGQFLLTAGVWTEALLKPFHIQPGIRPVRGQIALLNTGQPLLKRILLRGKRYIVPRDDGRVLVGSTEEDAGFEKRTTARAIGDLLAFAQTLVPALAEAQVEQCWAGLRPGSPDGMPFLGPVPGFENLFVAAGHFRAGIQLSPATGLLMAERMVGKNPTLLLDSFRLDRVPSSPSQSAFRS